MNVKFQMLLVATAIVSIPNPVAGQAPDGANQPGTWRTAVTETSMQRPYRDGGQAIVWTDADHAALREALAHRNFHGLDHLRFLSINADHGVASSIDRAYTRAALEYANALAHGYVDPSALKEVYTIDRPDEDLGSALAAAMRSGTLSGWLDGLAPEDAAYRQLSDAYVSASQAPAAENPAIQSSTSIHPGADNPSVAVIARQLTDDGYLGSVPDDAVSGRYSPLVVAAVRALQRDYGLREDGIVGPATLGVLNLRPGDRARALAVALERRRWLSRTPPPTRIDVNTAAAELRYFRDETLVDRRAVIVGKPGRETPSLGSPIYRLVANPTWTIPKSIQRTEMAHVGRAYLRAHNMRMRGGWIVQQPGPNNALGLVKFDMKNNQAIYLHDTSAPSLFDRSQRHLSHGCVRVKDALGFAELLANQEGVGDAWRTAHQSGDYTIVNLPREIPVRLLYHNVFIDDAGKVAIRTDPYGWNKAVATKLGFFGDAAKRAKAGAIDIGP